MADFNLAIPIIKRSEGGLSKNPNDTAARWPVPDGSGFHTNKGITWQTFLSNAKSLGYKATPELFYQMPDEVWNKITKKYYWDMVQGDKLKSQAVATILVDWYFGSGNWSIKNLQSVLNTHFGKKLKIDGSMGINTLTAANKVDQKKLTETLYQARIRFIEAISKKPGQSVFRNGWLDDAKHTFEMASSYLPTITGLGAIALGVFFL